ncbi:hypothetical protein D3C79_777900 [compost metagenome]
MPVLHCTDIVAGRAIAQRVIDLHQAIPGLIDVTFENVLAQLQQLILDRALVEHEEHLGTVQPVDGFKGDLARIARPDTNQQQLFHCKSLPWPGQPL